MRRSVAYAMLDAWRLDLLGHPQRAVGNVKHDLHVLILRRPYWLPNSKGRNCSTMTLLKPLPTVY